MPHINIAGNRIHFTTSRTEFQNSPTLLCVHGSGGSHAHWPEKLLTRKDICVVALDLPGHGKSQGEGLNTVEGYAGVLSEFVKSVGLDRSTLVGHSLGGAIAQALALRGPAWLEGIILVGTGARLRVAPSILDALQASVAHAADLVSAWAFGPSAPPDLVNAFRTELLQTPAAVTLGDFQACNNFDIMPFIGDIHIRALVISGSKDRLTPPKYGGFLANHIPGTKHVVIPDAGHMMALEYPEVFTKLVVSFVAPKSIHKGA